MILSTPMIGIALYDYTPESVNFKKFFDLMEGVAEQVEIPWESIGITTSAKLMQFKNGKRKLEKTNFEGITEIELLGGVSEPGTHLDWKTSASFSNRKRDDLCFCFEKRLFDEGKISLNQMLKEILTCADFQYGIVYEREYGLPPDSYASGTIHCKGNYTLTDEERKKIGAWMKKYSLNPHYYKTGLLRDVYPHNIFVETHLNQRVGAQTLRAWIEADPAHGRLEKLTDQHWLWSLDSAHIPQAQETLQEAGLLLCYKI